MRDRGPRGAGEALADAVRLVVSELATNVVQHTHGRSPGFRLEVRLDRHERLRIGVSDSDPAGPKRLPAAVQQDNGRGLVIIRAVAVEYGGRLWVEARADGGKTAWTELPWRLPVR